MQIKIIIFTLTTMTKVKQSDCNECWWEWGTARTLVHCWWKYKVVQPLWKTIPQFLKKKTNKQTRKPVLTIWPNDSTPGYSFKRNKNVHAHKNLCVNIHNFIHRTLESLHWRRQLWYIHSVECYSAMKYMMPVTVWMTQSGMLSDKSQAQKTDCYIISFIWNFWKQVGSYSGSNGSVIGIAFKGAWRNFGAWWNCSRKCSQWQF